MTSAAENTLFAATGVDIRPLVYRGKFVFVAQVGSPQIAGSILEVSVTSGSSCSATNLGPQNTLTEERVSRRSPVIPKLDELGTSAVFGSNTHRTRSSAR